MIRNLNSRILSAFLVMLYILPIGCDVSESSPEYKIDLEVSPELSLDKAKYDLIEVTLLNMDSSVLLEKVYYGSWSDSGDHKIRGIPVGKELPKQYIIQVTGYKNKVLKLRFLVFVKESQGTKPVLVYQYSPTSQIDPTQPNSDLIKVVDTNLVEPDTSKSIVLDTIPNTGLIGHLSDLRLTVDTSILEGDSLRLLITLGGLTASNVDLIGESLPLGSNLLRDSQEPFQWVFAWRPTFDQAKSEPYILTISQTDGKQKRDTTARIKVVNVNRRPEMKSIENQKVKEGEIVSFLIKAIDFDNDPLILSCDSLPIGAKIENGSFIWSTQVGQNGNYFLKFFASDKQLMDSQTVIITVGNILPPPEKPIVSSTSPTNNCKPIWKWKSGGGGSGYYRSNLDNEDFSGRPITTDSSFMDSKNLTETYHSLFVQEKNIDGVWSLSGKFTVHIDTTPPSAPRIINPSLSNNPKPTWSWIAGGGDGTQLFRYKLDSSDLNKGAIITKETDFKPQNNLSDGSHTLFIQECDSTGNWSLGASASILIDTDPPPNPKVEVDAPSPTKNRYPTFTWKRSGIGGIGVYRLKLDDSTLTAVNQTSTTLFQPSIPLGEGQHTLYVQEVDTAGNWSGLGHLTIRIDFTPPLPPKLSVSPSSPSSNPRPTWSWESLTSEENIGQFRLSLDSNGLDSANITNATSYSPTLPLSDGPHTLYIQQFDSAGNASSVVQSQVEIYTTTTVGAPGFSSGSARNVSLAMGKLGKLYVAFSDSSLGYKLTVMRFNGTSWNTVGPPGISAGEAKDVKILIHPSGTPYVAFNDVANGSCAKVLRFTNVWEQVGTQASAGAVASLGFSMGQNGVPIVGYMDNSFPSSDGFSSGAFHVMVFNGGEWVYLGKPGKKAWGFNLVVNDKNIPFAFFEVGGSSSMMVRYSDTGWSEFETQPTLGRADPNDLKIDGNGNIYLAFREDVDNSNGLGKVRKFDGSQWLDFGGSYFSQDRVRNFSLAMATSGVAYVAFHEGVDPGPLTLSKSTGIDWTPIPFIGGDGLYPWANGKISLALSDIGIAYVAFSDAGKGNKVTVVKYLP